MVPPLQPFEVREGMEGEHIPETHLTGCHQDLEERKRFKSSDLRLERCFLALLSLDTHTLTSFMEGTEITLSWIYFR